MAQGDEPKRVEGETTLNLVDGRIISDGAPAWLHQVIAQALSKAARVPAEQLTTQLLGLLDENDHAAAALLVANSLEAGAAAFPYEPLLAQIRRIRSDSLESPVDVAAFLRARCILSTVGNDYETAAADAQVLLASSHVADRDRSRLRLTIATAALKRGAVESSFAVFRDIAESDISDAMSRAWAFRNMSIIVPIEDERCEQYSRRSSDFFLMCGDKLEAAGSLVRAMRSRLAHKPLEAADLLNEPVEWFAGDGLHERYIRGGMLQNRARAAWLLKQYDRALADATESAISLRGLQGCEEEFATTLMFAIDAGGRIGAPVDAFAAEYDALVKASHGEEYALRQRVVACLQAFDMKMIQELRASDEVNRRPMLRAIVGMAEARSKTLSHVARLQVLEKALLDARESRDRQVETAVIQATGDELLTNGSLEQALTKYHEVLQREPINQEARQNYAFILQKLNRNEDGVRFLEDQQRLWGLLPGMTFTLARFLLGAGQVDRATNLFARLAATLETNEGIRKAAASWRDKAIAAGGRIQIAVKSAPSLHTREDLEHELQRFAGWTKKSKRMTFWRRAAESGRGHHWIEKPESHAKHLLSTFLAGAFDTGLKQFEEIATGAGRIDLFLELAGGVSAIVELKMVGAPYSSTYALQGEGQIAHYMDNRDCHLGYLVAFDARTQTWGELPLEDAGANTIIRIFIDVRPDVPSKPKGGTRSARKSALEK